MRVALSSVHSRPLPRQVAAAPTGASHAALSTRCAALARRLLGRGDPTPIGLSSRIRAFDVFSQPKQWARCREAGWYHLSRARRAIDREDWRPAEQHACRAIEWDDTRAANFLALGEVLLRRPQPDLHGARRALEAALELEPANSYIVDRLNAVYQQLGDWLAAARMLRRALAAGAPARVWEPELASLDARLATPLAS